jgi:integrase
MESEPWCGHPPCKTKQASSITSDDVQVAVRSLWSSLPEQGRRTLAAISQVFDYPMIGRCTARITRHRFPRRANARKHYTAMDYTEVPHFMRLLRVEQQRNAALSPYVIEFLVLTGCRGSEVVGMEWSEVDFDNKLWVVPAERTNARHEHRVPLPERAVELLDQERKISGNSHV